jgi:hypothetical protein
MNKIEVTEKVNSIIDSVSKTNRYYGITMQIVKLNPASQFKILFELIDKIRLMGNKHNRYNAYLFFIMTFNCCKFDNQQYKLIYRRIFFNYEFVNMYLFNYGNDVDDYHRIHRLIGKEPAFRKVLRKVIMKHRNSIFTISDIIYCFRDDLSDNTIDFILNVLLKHVDKDLIDMDTYIFYFINSNHKFTPNQKKKIDAIKIMIAINNN